MGVHSDRDRSERAWWPPAATRQGDLGDEPIPFVLVDEPAGSPLHETARDRDAADTVADDHRMRAQIRTLAGALRTEAQGLRVDTFLRPANVTTAIFLENVADLLVAEVGP